MKKPSKPLVTVYPRATPRSMTRLAARTIDRHHAWLTGILIVSAALCIVIIGLWSFGQMNGIWAGRLGFWKGLLWMKTIIEVVACLYAVFFFLVALNYRVPVERDSPSDFTESQVPLCNETERFRHEEWGKTGGVPSYTEALYAISDAGACQWGEKSSEITRVAVGYLCCDDLDRQALDSIARYCGGAEVPIIIHDDSVIEENRFLVDQTAARLRRIFSRDVRVIRRGERVGGKPGAVNNLVNNLSSKNDYLLLCDSDSFFYDRTSLTRALRYFQDPKVALVQFRNVGHVRSNEVGGYAALSESVTFYDTFVLFLDLLGWSPFLGHNALLRLDVFKEVGGFVPGQLADDIDYSVRLRLSGYKIRYGRDIVAGERHPATYSALRRRTFKWAFGCTQILKGSAWKVLCSAKIAWSEKFTFFLTVGYYHFQMLLLAYLVFFYLMLPFVDPSMGGLVNLTVSAGIILLLTFLPSLSYFIRQKRLSDWLPVIVIWAFVYGSQDFVMLRAILSCLAGRRLEWIPTNLVLKTHDICRLLPEFFWGSLIVTVALLKQPLLLFLPTTVLFAGKYIMAPFFQRIVFPRTL